MRRLTFVGLAVIVLLSVSLSSAIVLPPEKVRPNEQISNEYLVKKTLELSPVVVNVSGRSLFPWDRSLNSVTFNSGPHGNPPANSDACRPLEVQKTDYENQNGLDFGMAGEEVLAVANAVIKGYCDTGSDGSLRVVGEVPDGCSGGKAVALNLTDGGVIAFYHLSAVESSIKEEFASRGDADVRVGFGRVLGIAGDHLHMEIYSDGSEEISWYGQPVNGWQVWSILVPQGSETDPEKLDKAYKYYGTLTRGQVTWSLKNVKCDNSGEMTFEGLQASGSITTILSDINGSPISSDNRRHDADFYCGDWPVGFDSSRHWSFIEAYEGNGGRANFGCTQDRTRWWPSEGSSPRFVIQDFTGMPDDPHHTDGVIVHDEDASAPEAYALFNLWPIWRNHVGWGAPTGDETPAWQSPYGTTGNVGRFRDFDVYLIISSGTYEIDGQWFKVGGVIRQVYDEFGRDNDDDCCDSGSGSSLGFPRSSAEWRQMANGEWKWLQLFEGGAILCDSENGPCEPIVACFDLGSTGLLSLQQCPPGLPTYDAEDAGTPQDIYVDSGESFDVTISVRNSGTAIWQEGDKVRLGLLTWDDQMGANLRYGLNPGETVAPGTTRSWTVHLTAPTTPGTYMQGWQMVGEDGVVGWFGDLIRFEIHVAGGFTCTDAVSVGAGSSRQQLFINAFNRMGGSDSLGCTRNSTHWWGDGERATVIQDFTGNAGANDVAIIHDEQRDHPVNSVPAYVVRGAIWNHYVSRGGWQSWLGPPTSDEFINSTNQPQSNFHNGYISWGGNRWQAFRWPEQNANWRAEYHNGRNLNAYSTYVRNEDAIDHDWGTGAPGGGRWGVWPDNFSVRWVKTVSFEAGRYRFDTWSDDGVRLWIDNQLIIDEWHSGGSQSHSAEVTLAGGDHHVRFEYFEDSGPAYVRLTWEKLDAPANQAPNAPSLESPTDGRVVESGDAPTLCWQNNGDPDDNPATLQFLVDVQGAGSASSGWIDQTCWRPGSLDRRAGDYTWRVKARDGDGVESGWSATWGFTIRVSNDPPTISFDTANGDGFPSNRIWSRERNWTFQGTAGDPEGRLDRIEFRCSGDNCGSQTRHDGLSNWQHEQADMAGRNDVYFVAVDDEHSTASRHLELDIDLAAPATTFSLNDETKANLADWSNKWFTGPVQVRLQAADRGTDRARSGVQEIQYRLDGGSWQTSSGNSVGLTVSTDGTHTVEYYAVDRVGNAESAHSATFKIDQTPPSPPSGASETHGVVSDQWQKDYNMPTFTWAASDDAASGVWGYQFYFGPEPDGVAYQTFLANQPREWTPKSGGVRTGTYYLRGRTRDNAGNWSNWVSLFTFRYDGTPPENPKEAAHAGGVTHDTWQNSTNLADFTWPRPHDEGSGINGYRVYWGSNSAGTSSDQIQSESFQSTTPLCDTDAACTGYLRLRSVDHVNNLAEEWSTVFVLRYDNAPPVVDDFNINGTVTQTTQTLVTLDITASDEGSGVREVMVSNHSDFEDAQWEVYAEERLWTVPAISRQWWPVYVKVRDGVGLPSAVISDTIYLDVNPKQPRSASFRLFDHALSAGAGVYTGTTSTGEVAYTGRGTVGQVIGHNTGQAAGAAQLSSLNYLITGGYEAGSQARPIEEPGHDEFTFINGIFASGTGAETLHSPLYQMLSSAGEVALPNNETTLNSSDFQHQPGFLAAKPPLQTPTPTSTPPPGPTPTPEPAPAFAQISIDNGAPFTSDLNVTLSITAPLAIDMKLSNDETFADAEWEPYTATKAWTLAVEGQQVMPRFVYAKFRDSEGTEHGVYFDDIIYDPNAPDGALSPNESMVDEDASLAAAFANSESAKSLADEASAGSQVKYVQRLGDQELVQPMALLSTNDDGSVNLYVNAQDDNSGLTEMQVGASSTFDGVAWEPQSALKPWVPEGGDGIKTVYARFRDNAGNVSEPAQTSFILDTLPPFGAIAIDRRVVGPDVLDVPLRLAAVDNLSGVADVRISQDPDFNTAVWQPYATSATWPISLTAQSDGALYVQYRDLEGNVSAVYSDTYKIDTTPPELYVEVSSGDTFTRSLTILAYDELADVTTMYLSNDPLMIEGVVEQPYSESVEWTFDERGVVWVQAEDSVGNISEPVPAHAALTAICDLAGNDGIITAQDIQELIKYWRDVIGPPYDRDGDDEVTVADIMWFVARWGGGCQ